MNVRRKPVVDTARIQRERLTIRLMIAIYCRHHHDQEQLCHECEILSSYAMKRIDRCQFLPEKPTCATCPVHCYQVRQREQIRQVMRFAGPKMLIRHPYLTIMHYVDEYRFRLKS